MYVYTHHLLSPMESFHGYLQHLHSGIECNLPYSKNLFTVKTRCVGE